MATPPVICPNTSIACPICRKEYPTANHMLSLTCADEGCCGELCYNCMSKSVLSGSDEASTAMAMRCSL